MIIIFKSLNTLFRKVKIFNAWSPFHTVSISKILYMEHNLSQLSIIVSCRRQSENTNSRIQAVKIWILKFLSQIILTFFKQTLEFFDFGICLCWFCCLRHQKSHAFCVIFALLLAHTDSLWHRCRNISGLEWFCCFHYCHQKSKDFFLFCRLYT